MVHDLSVNLFTVQSLQPLKHKHTESLLQHYTQYYYIQHKLVPTQEVTCPSLTSTLSRWSRDAPGGNKAVAPPVTWQTAERQRTETRTHQVLCLHLFGELKNHVYILLVLVSVVLQYNPYMETVTELFCSDAVHPSHFHQTVLQSHTWTTSHKLFKSPVYITYSII